MNAVASVRGKCKGLTIPEIISESQFCSFEAVNIMLTSNTMFIKPEEKEKGKQSKQLGCFSCHSCKGTGRVMA